jgi:hypothetical protein
MRSLETVLAMAKDIFSDCKQKETKKTLIDVRKLGGRLRTMESYEIPDKHFPKMQDRSVITHAAIVDLKEFEHSYQFFEDVAVNRGFTLRILSDLDRAAEWLSKVT